MAEQKLYSTETLMLGTSINMKTLIYLAALAAAAFPMTGQAQEWERDTDGKYCQLSRSWTAPGDPSIVLTGSSDEPRNILLFYYGNHRWTVEEGDQIDAWVTLHMGEEWLPLKDPEGAAKGIYAQTTIENFSRLAAQDGEKLEMIKDAEVFERLSADGLHRGMLWLKDCIAVVSKAADEYKMRQQMPKDPFGQ
ncbi:hypothetical protein [Croceicoccus gelatinilyticus]|uniref:hypothetical protein n=1 Tax=Croceicoccus gelatinilyticus TaxID=2835536 RepID=UPI001BD131FE|nr:hypothetical protein [Croceicoccus gelatinilyticus]MBS7671418.1 hypothetical protein [Croceicoccus gelatinilyticus]